MAKQYIFCYVFLLYNFTAVAILQEIHVNQGLYFLVFGESLFNDGVTVVLYNTMQSLLAIDTVGLTETLMAILSFFLVAFGGALIGFLAGLFASYVTKYTQQERFTDTLPPISRTHLSFRNLHRCDSKKYEG